MKKISYLLYAAGAFIIYVMLMWYFSVPPHLIEDELERTISESLGTDIRVEISGFNKGPFFTMHFNDLDIYRIEDHALNVSNISVRVNPMYFYNKHLTFTLDGSIGNGYIEGKFELPDGGTIKAGNVDLGSIDYLQGLGVSSAGSITASSILSNDSFETKFKVENFSIESSFLNFIPLISSFRTVQGLITVKGNDVTISSLTFEGDKGYARAKGNIMNGSMDMVFELMPETGMLEDFEKMLIKQYESSPGYYVIPYKGRLSL
jgi:type II secretion system protein N